MSRGRKIVKEIELERCGLANAAAEFYNHNKVKGLSPATQKGYRQYVDNFINWIGNPAFPADEINSKMLDDYLLYKADGGANKTTQRTVMVHLRKFFHFCAERNYMDTIDITIPKAEQTVKDPYTAAEMKLLLARPKTRNWVDWRNWAMVNYFYGTGQRLSTVLNIKLEDLDFCNSRVKLIWNKDKIQKFMPLSSAVIKILEEYVKLSGLEDGDYLFPEYEGGQMKNRSAEDSIAKYNKERGVAKTSIHLFRHTFARDYILAGGNPAKLQKLLNHKTIDMTMHYVNLYASDISSDLDLFNPLDNFKRSNHQPQKRKFI